MTGALGVLAPGLLTAAAVAVWCGAPAATLLRRGVGAAGSDGPAARVARRRWSPSAGRPPVLLAVAACGGVLAVTGLSGALLAAAAALVAAAVGWLRALGRRRRTSEDVGRQATEACDALVAELRAGQPPARALERVADDYPALRPAARAAALGGDVPASLRGAHGSSDGRRRAPALPGSPGLSALAAAWQVAEVCGSGLTATLERVADTLRAEHATRAEVAAALAPARATARLLAVLPLFGLLLGSGLGGDPVGVLLGSTAGHALLLGGAVLSVAGTVWVERIADGVETP